MASERSLTPEAGLVNSLFGNPLFNGFSMQNNDKRALELITAIARRLLIQCA